MSFHVRRAFEKKSDERARVRDLVRRLKSKAAWVGVRQVRLYKGCLRTYPYPAPRGYGTRGTFVGIYTKSARRAWIEEDVMQVLMGEEQ